ncbi:MAG: hypothetical protein HC902_10605 [Calothrix sp. SM1_5_4]|nr:hypothetical protein [Calothrix sp. SM1_5_4]
MRSRLKVFIPLALVCFSIGVGWGVVNNRQQYKEMAQSTPLRVLCAENWLSDSVLDRFSRQHKVPIQLYTYARPSEFLRQMANSDGKIDVVCTSSLLLKSLVQNRWVRKADYLSLGNVKLLSVDFVHLPYDPDAEYSVPLFWNLYGFFGKGDEPGSTWKQTMASKKVTFWGEELNILNAMENSGVKIQDKLEQEETNGIEQEVKSFLKNVAQVLKPDTNPVTGEAVTAKADWILLPLARVARLLGENSPYKFWLPEDGSTMEVGLLAIGEKSSQPKLALALINELLSTEHAIQVNQRLKAGTVHESLGHMDSISSLQKAQALRNFPLNRFRFPDLDVEVLPRFGRIFAESVGDKTGVKSESNTPASEP